MGVEMDVDDDMDEEDGIEEDVDKRRKERGLASEQVREREGE